MKNKLLTVLPVLTALFVGLTLGLFLGRNPAGSSVTVSAPAQSETAPIPSAAEPPADILLVDINTADAAELAGLPGIGEVLAQRIIDYRTLHGSFTAVEQLMGVEGIGEGKLEDILDWITIGG